MRNVCITIFLLLACLVMISGMTSAYFTAQSNLINTFHTTTTLEIDMKADCDNDWDDWKPGEENAKRVTWTIQNKGNAELYLRAKIEGQWLTGGIGSEGKGEGVSSETLPPYFTVAEEVYKKPRRSVESKEFSIDTDYFEEPIVTRDYIGSGWKQGNDGDDYWYYTEILSPGDEAKLTFEICLEKISVLYLGAEYQISLTAEVIQSANNAIDSLPGWNIP